MSALAEKQRRPVGYDPLRELRHTDALAAREATQWLSELEFARKSPRTISEYGRLVDGLLGAHPGLRLHEFDEDHLTEYIASFPPPSRPVVKSALSGWFKWAYRKRKIPANPVDLVADIKAREQSIVPTFTDAQMSQLCNLPSPDGVLMRLLFTTGVRRGEACALQVKHVNLDRRHLEVIRGKGGSDRLIPLAPVVLGKLDHWFTTDGMNRDDFLWYSRPGGHWREHSRRVAPSTYQRWWSTCLADAGVEYLRPHCTRHTFATHAIRNGMSVDKVRRILGHRNIATTVQTYVHMSVDDMHDDVAALEVF